MYSQSMPNYSEHWNFLLLNYHLNANLKHLNTFRRAEGGERRHGAQTCRLQKTQLTRKLAQMQYRHKDAALYPSECTFCKGRGKNTKRWKKERLSVSWLQRGSVEGLRRGWRMPTSLNPSWSLATQRQHRHNGLQYVSDHGLTRSNGTPI